MEIFVWISLIFLGALVLLLGAIFRSSKTIHEKGMALTMFIFVFMTFSLCVYGFFK